MSFSSLARFLELALVWVAGAAPNGLPPVTMRPRSATTSAASHQLVERARAAEHAGQPDQAIVLLHQAVATEPANHGARVALAASLLEQYPDEALAIVTELRDARCRPCLRAVTDFVDREGARTDDATVLRKLEALAGDAHGRPTRVTRAANAVWAAFERKEWRLLAPYVGDPIRIKRTLMNADPTEVSSLDLSPARMRIWFERQTGLDLHRDEAWFCTDRCCEYWSRSSSRNDVTNYLERICFDTTGERPILTRLEWEAG